MISKYPQTILLLLMAFLAIAGCRQVANSSTPKTEANHSQTAGQEDISEPQQAEEQPANLIEAILLNQIDVPPCPEDWRIIESSEFNCKVAWPVDDEFEEQAMHFASGAPYFSFGFAPRDKKFSIDHIADVTEKKLARASTSLFSKNVNVGQEVLCRAFAFKNSTLTQIVRIYITEEYVWVISAADDDGKFDRDDVKHFFGTFEVDKRGNKSASEN